MKKDKTANVIGLVMIVTLFAKVLGIVREALQAGAYGTMISADMYTTAYNSTTYLYTTLAYALCIASVPAITQAMTRDRKSGEQTANNIITVTVVLSLIAAAVWYVLTYTPWVSTLWNGTAEELATVARYVRILALTLPIITVTYLLVAVFQSLDHFVLQGSMSIPYNVLLIAFLFIAGKGSDMETYVIFVAAAWLLQLAMTVPYSIKEKYVYRPRIDLKQPYLKDYFKTAVVNVFTTSIFLFCYLQDAASAAKLGEGSVSAFYYADKLFTPLTTTLIYSISTVMFPKFNREYTKSGKDEYLSYIWGIVKNTLLFILPISAMFMVFGGSMVKVLFESGNFTAESTAATASIFGMYAWCMAGFCVLDLLNKAYYTMQKTLTPLLVNAGIIIVNFLLNYLMGGTAAGLALGTSISLTVGAVVMAVLLFGKQKADILPIIKSFAASAVMGAALYFGEKLFVNGGEGKIMLVAKCCVLGVAGLAIYGVLSVLLKQRELVDIVKSKLKR